MRALAPSSDGVARTAAVRESVPMTRRQLGYAGALASTGLAVAPRRHGQVAIAA
jgi:hypothetical protein